MKRKIIITGLAIAIATGISPAWADDPASLIEQMRTGQIQLSALTSQEEDLTAKSERDLREFNVYLDNFGQLEAQKKAKLDSFAKSVEPRAKAANGIVEEWNSQCAEERVGKLEEAAFNACETRKAEIKPVVDGIRSSIHRDADAYSKKEIAPIEAIQQKQKKAMDETSLRIKDRFTTWQGLKSKSDALTAELERIRTVLVEKCTHTTTDEELRHCYSIGWDGARQDLPPLKNIRPPFSMKPDPQ
jgi:hypothetical protein